MYGRRFLTLALLACAPVASARAESFKQWLCPADPHVRAGHPQQVHRLARPTITPQYCFGYVGGGAVRATNKDDAWTVFFDEREKLIEAWDRLGKPVLVLTGDLHNSFAIRITDRVWEFASGPHNSNNHWYTDEGDRPPNGPFQYGPRACDIRWSSFYRSDIPRDQLTHPIYCVVQVNNVFNNPREPGEERWVAFPGPHVVFQYYDGRSGDLLYAEPIHATRIESGTRE